MEINEKTIKEIFRFGLTGGLATVLHYGIYYLLMNVMNTTVVYGIGYFLSFIFNYFMSAHFTFHAKTTKKNGVGFLGAHAFNFLMHMVLLNVFLAIGIPKQFAPIPVYCILIPLNFVLVRFAFHKK